MLQGNSWLPVVKCEPQIDRQSRTRNLSMGTHIWSAIKTYVASSCQFVVPTINGSKVLWHDNNNERIPFGDKFKNQSEKNDQPGLWPSILKV